MGKRFIFINSSNDTLGEAFRGPFNSTPVPRIGEEVTIKCFDKITRIGLVYRISWVYTLPIEVKIFIKFVAQC